MKAHHLTVLGPPRTKKNSARIWQRRDGTPFVMPSKASVTWTHMAVPQLRKQWGHQPPLTGPLHVRAAVYRKTRVGDLTNYLQAISDGLQTAGVIEDDKLIVAIDAVLGYDHDNPRVEVWVTPMTGYAGIRL